MSGTEHEFADEALRVAVLAARVARGNRDNAIGDMRGRKRPRRHDERRDAGKTRRAMAQVPDATTQRLFGALRQSTAKPICDGGLAHYFISEAHRRAALSKPHKPRAASSLSLTSIFDAIAAAKQKDTGHASGRCPVCMDDNSCDSIALPCGHAFHKRCLVSWLQVNSSCPCCRALVPPSKPYRYPARTKLWNPLLRARVEGMRLDMCDVARRTLHLEGMQGTAGLVCIVSPAAPLVPVPAMPRDEPPRDPTPAPFRL